MKEIDLLLKNWIVQKVNQKIRGIEAVLSKPEKYNIRNKGKLQDALMNWKRFLEWFLDVPTKQGSDYATDVVGLQEKKTEEAKEIQDLKTRLDQLEVIVKKLVAFHKGEV